MKHSGSCKCGAVKFEVDGDPTWSGYCHCRDCRKATAAPVSAFVVFKKGDVHWTGSAPEQYQSSEHVIRTFCATCGSPISYQFDGWPDRIDLYTCLFDDADSLPPTAHIWYPQKLSWLHVEDALPKYDEDV